MKKTLLGLCLLALGLNAAELKIGVVLPLTGSVAAYGQDVYAGIDLANKIAPKTANNDEIKLVVIDSKGDKIESANAASRLIAQDKVVALIGEAITANTMQVISAAEANKIPMIAPVASGDKLLNGKKYSSRVCFMDSFQGQKFAQYASKDLNYKTAILITDQANVYSLGLGKVFEQEFQKNGGKILAKLSISSGDKDFKAIVAQLMKSPVDVVYMPIYHPEAALIAKQARALGFKGQFAAGDGVNNTAFTSLGGEAVNGVIFTDSFDASSATSEVAKNFINEYEKQKGTREVPAFSAMGADAYFVLLNAINSCGADSECINKAIHSTTNFQSVGGNLSIDESGNAVRPVIIKEIVNGKQSYKATIEP